MQLGWVNAKNLSSKRWLCLLYLYKPDIAYFQVIILVFVAFVRRCLSPKAVLPRERKAPLS